MRSSLISLYHRLPPSLRSLAASLRGYQLRRMRYGADTEKLVAEALETERLPPAEIDRRVQERLQYVLARAAREVPYYRQFWRGPGAAGRDPERLSDWPVLEKEAVRTAKQDFVVDGCDPSSMIAEHSSGTTGKPLHLWWSREAARRHYAIFEARWRRWYGHARRATDRPGYAAQAAVLGLELGISPALHVVVSSLEGDDAALSRGS
jgi:phenylacetate-CoA ligase